MRSLYVIHSPQFGGPHNTVAKLAGTLKAKGVETLVVLPNEADEAAARLTSAGVEVITMPLHRARAVLSPSVQLNSFRSARAEIRTLAQLMRDRQIDVAVATSLPNPHTALAARSAGAAVVWQILDSFSPMVFRRIMMPFVLHYSDSIMTTGQKIAESHPGVTSLGDRWVKFFPSVDMDEFRPNPDLRLAARKQLGIPPELAVVGNVSNINPMKGHLNFVRAAAALRTSNPHVVFVILGATYPNHGRYYDAVRNEVELSGFELGKDFIIFNPEADVSRFAQAFDIFWMTSEPRSEGIPTVIGEAKALAMPVVTTDVGSTSESVTEGRSGHVVPPGDPAAIAEATRHLLADRGEASAFGVEARREAEVTYSLECGTAAHIRAYELAMEHRLSVLERRRRPRTIARPQ